MWTFRSPNAFLKIMCRISRGSLEKKMHVAGCGSSSSMYNLSPKVEFGMSGRGRVDGRKGGRLADGFLELVPELEPCMCFLSHATILICLMSFGSLGVVR